MEALWRPVTCPVPLSVPAKSFEHVVVTTKTYADRAKLVLIYLSAHNDALVTVDAFTGAQLATCFLLTGSSAYANWLNNHPKVAVNEIATMAFVAANRSTVIAVDLDTNAVLWTVYDTLPHSVCTGAGVVAYLMTRAFQTCVTTLDALSGTLLARCPLYTLRARWPLNTGNPGLFRRLQITSKGRVRALCSCVVGCLEYWITCETTDQLIPTGRRHCGLPSTVNVNDVANVPVATSGCVTFGDSVACVFVKNRQNFYVLYSLLDMRWSWLTCVASFFSRVKINKLKKKHLNWQTMNE